MLLQLSQFFPLLPAPPGILHSFQDHPPAFSSCPWVMHTSSLASPFPILFLTSPCLFWTYQFVLLNPFTFSPILSFPLPKVTTQMISISMILSLFCLFVQFVFSDPIVDSCEFIAILMFIVLIFFFLLN